jgi:hypothetical protein
LDDEIDEGFWLRYKLGTWLRQVVDELAHPFTMHMLDHMFLIALELVCVALNAKIVRLFMSKLDSKQYNPL